MDQKIPAASSSRYAGLNRAYEFKSAFTHPSSSTRSSASRVTNVENSDSRQTRKGTLTEFKAGESDARVVHVQYPGIVENPANALRTLGGIVKVSEAFHHPQRKLELRFRPADVFCNPIHGSGRTTVGLLVRVRRKKKKETPVIPQKKAAPKLVDLNEDSSDISGVLEELCRVTGQQELEEQRRLKQEVEQISRKTKKSKKKSKTEAEPADSVRMTSFMQKLIQDEAEIAKNLKSEVGFGPESKLFTPQECKSELATVKTVVKIPKGRYAPAKSDLNVETVGVVVRAYEFSGVSDLQFLPTIPDQNGEQVSIAQNIFPGFGDPDNGLEFDYEDPEIPKTFFPFMLPHYLSHVDKPVQNIFKPFMSVPEDSAGANVSEEKAVESTRQRRSVYTYMMDFRWREQGESEVPREPFYQALEDAAKKFYDPANLETIRRLFQERPVWTKLALQWETKLSAENLKYLLPCVAYFSLNGPWRSLWIRFGYDPRNEKTAFTYQLVDFRFPLEYRGYLELDQDDQENYFKFKPNKIPPKSQMFYQLCEIKIPEIEELQGALTVRLNKQSDVTMDPKYGYLDEDIMEFCRYCMSRCIEVRLFELGKISSVNLPPVRLEAGGAIPVDQLKVKYKKPKKRIRQMPTGKGRRKRSSVPEVAQVTFEFPREVAGEGGSALADYFDDDEEMEEEDVEPYGREYEHEGVSGNLDDCFEDDEEEEDD